LPSVGVDLRAVSSASGVGVFFRTVSIICCCAACVPRYGVVVPS
jgi:hypothetical protein